MLSAYEQAEELIDYCEENPIVHLILVQCQLEFYIQIFFIFAPCIS